MKSTAMHKKCLKNARKKNNKHVLHHMEKLSKINWKTKNIERAQRIASEAQTQIEKNLEKILTSLFSKLESKIEQITKSAYERLRIDIRSQIYN